MRQPTLTRACSSPGWKGFVSVVIGPGGQTFNHFRFVGVAGKDDDIGVELFMALADTLA